MIVPSVRSCAAWEHFPHDADVGVRGFGATPAEAFKQAALALTAVVTAARVEPLSSVEIGCEAPDLELLFVDLLNAIIYEMAVRSMLFGRFDVRIEGTALTATQPARARSRRAPQKPSFAGCTDRHISFLRNRQFELRHRASAGRRLRCNRLFRSSSAAGSRQSAPQIWRVTPRDSPRPN